jgi:hypothetical protein
MYHITLKSANKKTGPIPVTTSTAKTCPDACPFKAGGCYAKGGPLALHWRAITEGRRGDSLESLCTTIKTLPDGQLWRHNQAGDLPGDGDIIDNAGLAMLINANRGKRGFTYSHKPLTKANASAIKAANEFGFTINASANSLAHADHIKATHPTLPVVAVVPEDWKGKASPAGNRVVVCPATQRDDVSCATCTLCQRAKRDFIIAFPAHGASKRKAEAIASM